MQEVELFNLGPIFKLLLLAAVVAMGPLAWVWLRHRHQDAPQRVRQLTALTLFLCFDLVLFGSFTQMYKIAEPDRHKTAENSKVSRSLNSPLAVGRHEVRFMRASMAFSTIQLKAAAAPETNQIPKHAMAPN